MRRELQDRVRRPAAGLDVSVIHMRTGEPVEKSLETTTPVEIVARGEYASVLRWLAELTRPPTVDIDHVQMTDVAGDGMLRIEISGSARDRGVDPDVRRWTTEPAADVAVAGRGGRR